MICFAATALSFAAEPESAVFRNASLVFRVVNLTKTVPSCDKFCWYEAKIVKVLKNNPEEIFEPGMTVKFAVYSGTPNPPTGELSVYLKKYKTGKNAVKAWKLIQDFSDKGWGDPTLSCEKRGGQWRLVGKAGNNICVLPYSDGGKECTDSSQCLAGCYYHPPEGQTFPQPKTVVKGTCRKDSNPFGCFVEVKDGKTMPGLCAD